MHLAYWHGSHRTQEKAGRQGYKHCSCHMHNNLKHFIFFLVLGYSILLELSYPWPIRGITCVVTIVNYTLSDLVPYPCVNTLHVVKNKELRVLCTGVNLVIQMSFFFPYLWEYIGSQYCHGHDVNCLHYVVCSFHFPFDTHCCKEKGFSANLLRGSFFPQIVMC